MKAPHQQQDGQPTDFGMAQQQQQQQQHQQKQLTPPPSTSGSISPNSGGPLQLGAADPSSVESNQSNNVFHHTNMAIGSNANGIIANGGGGGLLSPPSRSGAAPMATIDCGIGTSSSSSLSSSSSSMTTTTTFGAVSASTAGAPTMSTHLLLGMAPATNINNNNNIINNNNNNNVAPTVAHNRESIVDASTMHQKMLEAASAISNSVMSSMPNPSAANWPYSLNAQHLLGGIQMAASRPHHDLYNSILGGLQPAAMLKTEPPTIGSSMITSLPTDASSASVGATILPCHSSASSFSIGNFTIASSRLILCGFTAYIEQNLCNSGGMAIDGEENRVEIIKIPKISDAPLERIGLDCVQSKYPELLQELFKKGPTDAFFLVKCWANMHFNFGDQHNSLFAVDSFYESSEKFDIIVSTKVCSFGNEVVEKVEIYSPIDEEEEAKCSGVWHFRLEKSPMCEYMVRFISELKKLQEPSLMNSVLENFTVLQIVTDKQSNDTLMVIAFMFGIREDANIRDDGEGDDEIFTNIYRITE